MRERYALHIAVFIASFAVMGLEVIGLGILAPNYSTALVVQTNVIGVVLIGLAIGYRLGGVRADRGVTSSDIARLLFIAVVWVVLVFSFRELIANVLAWYTESISVGSLFTSLTLFLVPSIALGMVLPYAIKVHVQDVSRSGTSSGVLYALATIGSVVGTFSIAFLVLPKAQHPGSIFLIVVALTCSLFVLLPKWYRRCGLILGLSFALLYLAPIPETVFHKKDVMSDGRLKSNVYEWTKLADESGVFSRIQVYGGTEFGTGRPTRFMLINGEVHSGIYENSNELLFNYARYNRFGGHFNPAAKKALLVGGGAYTYANYFLTDTPLYDIEKVWALDGRYYHNNKTVSLPVLFTNNLAKRGKERELVYESTKPRTSGEMEGLYNHIDVDNQAPSTTVVVKQADIMKTGFETPNGYVHIHETKHDGTPGRVISDDIPLEEYLNRPRTIIGKGDLITGENDNVHVHLDRPVREGEVLYAMLHRDNGNGHFDDFLVDGYEQTEHLDVVEIDPRTTRLAETYFDLNRNDPRLRIFHEDARVYFNRTKDTYDIIYLDAFRSFYAVPWQLATIEATRRIYDMLNEDGVVVANIPAGLKGPYSKFFQSELKTYREVFPEVRVFAVFSPEREEMMQNIIFVAFKNKDNIRETLSDDPEINQQLAHRWYGEIEADTPILTDDFSPTDYYTNSFSELHFF